MRTLLVLALLALGGCSKNRDQLRAIRDRMQLELAERSALANNLTERRQEVEALEQELNAALDAGVRLEPTSPPIATASPPAPLPPPELPAPSLWEGTESERTRQQIADLHARIAELDKAIGEVNTLDQRKRELTRKLDKVKQLERAADQTNEPY